MDVFVLKEDCKWMRIAHRFAKIGGWRYFVRGKQTDFCYWARRVFIGALFVTLALLLVVSIWGMIASAVYPVISGKFDTWPEWLDWLVSILFLPIGLIFAVVVFLVGGALLGGMMWAMEWAQTKWHKRQRQDDSELSKAWAAFRKRYCIRIEVPRSMSK